MITSAPKPGSLATRRFEAADARADGGRRVVMLERDRVVIARGVAGVFMQIALEPQTYRGVLLRLMRLDDEGFHYEVRLAHNDPDFGVALAECADQAEAELAWSHWARFFRLPKLVERVEGVPETQCPMIGGVAARSAVPRRNGRGLRRRPRFLARRKIGRPELCEKVAADRELFAGWRPEV